MDQNRHLQLITARAYPHVATPAVELLLQKVLLVATHESIDWNKLGCSMA